MIAIIIIIVVVVLLALYLIGIYNGFVKMRNNRENAFANIDVQLKQRHDLIPQLVASVKGYATHEKELLENLTKARTAAMSANTIDEKIQAENQLSTALNGLKVAVEAYPDLKATKTSCNYKARFPTSRTNWLLRVASSTRLLRNSTMPLKPSPATSLLVCLASIAK